LFSRRAFLLFVSGRVKN